uniref:Sentrin-specific protease 6 n=1 Tax=Iconisemion striatum TaxID=60296 RepID=A0A1A7YVN1_9TELE
MAQNTSFFLEALDRSETTRDGGFKHSWGFSLPDDREKAKKPETGPVSVEEMERHQTTCPEEKSPPFRRFGSGPSRVYENRSNSHIRPLNKLLPKTLSSIQLTPPTSSPMASRNDFFIISPIRPPGILIQGRHFQHTHVPVPVKKPVQRNELSSTQQEVEVDSIVLTCPEVPGEETLNIKRRVQQRRKSLENVSSQIEASQPLVFHSVCLKCNKPSDDVSRCQICGSGESLLSSHQTTSPSPRPPIRTQNCSGPNSLQQNFYKPSTTTREILPVRVTSTRGTVLSVNCSRTPLLAGISTSCGTGTSTRTGNPAKGRRRTAQQHELNDPIVLSSDDDEEADSASTGSVNRLDSVSPRPADSAHSSPAPSGGRVEAAVKSTAEDEEFNTDFLENVNMKITIPRRARMKDQFGNQPPAPCPSRTKRPKIMSNKCDSIILECRSVRIGTLRRMVTKPVIFSVDQIQLETEGLEKGSVEKVCLRASELISCEWCNVRKLPVLFFQTSMDECVRLRSQLKMSQENGGQWFDSSADGMDEKYIVLIFENGLVMKEQMILEDILHFIGKSNKVNKFPSKLSFEEANVRLVNYNKASSQKWEKVKPAQIPSSITKVSPAPAASQTVCTRMATRQRTSSYFEEEDENMTDLQPAFTGPIEKLMVYPPPPAKGGITVTNEDLHCLNDGEFLNDVIIDFYLKYLVLERLKKEDAQRIHVFSSFFYKRLNQRERRTGPDANNLPIQKRKHNRVKTWTRHVDLFQKDFIFVPINESAHWYLAVICFPGLEGPVFEKNPLYHSPMSISSPVPALQSEENIPEHCRPLSPDGDGLDGSWVTPSPTGSAEPECDPVSENSEGLEPQVNNRAEPELQFSSELHRIGVTYGSVKGDDDTYTFSDDQSSCQDECSEDGALAEDAGAADVASLASKPTICKQPCILIMDSLRGPARSTVVKTLREYLEVEWEVRKGSRRSFGKEVMRGSSPRVPQQDNFSDCGVYILQYVESFFQTPIPSFDLPVNLSEWFPQQRMKSKRLEIKELILKIRAQQELDRKDWDQVEAVPGSPEEPEIKVTLGSKVLEPSRPVSS